MQYLLCYCHVYTADELPPVWTEVALVDKVQIPLVVQQAMEAASLEIASRDCGFQVTML